MHTKSGATSASTHMRSRSCLYCNFWNDQSFCLRWIYLIISILYGKDFVLYYSTSEVLQLPLLLHIVVELYIKVLVRGFTDILILKKIRASYIIIWKKSVLILFGYRVIMSRKCSCAYDKILILTGSYAEWKFGAYQSIKRHVSKHNQNYYFRSSVRGKWRFIIHCKFIEKHLQVDFEIHKKNLISDCYNPLKLYVSAEKYIHHKNTGDSWKLIFNFTRRLSTISLLFLWPWIYRPNRLSIILTRSQNRWLVLQLYQWSYR